MHVVVQLVAFWSISALQLLLLMNTLPRDQDIMEAELALYAAQTFRSFQNASSLGQASMARDDGGLDCAEDELVVTTIAERMTSFDEIAAKETLLYVQAGIQELRSPFRCPTDTMHATSSRDSERDFANDLR
jgi:hypothetical protein